MRSLNPAVGTDPASARSPSPGAPHSPTRTAPKLMVMPPTTLMPAPRAQLVISGWRSREDAQPTAATRSEDQAHSRACRCICATKRLLGAWNGASRLCGHLGLSELSPSGSSGSPGRSDLGLSWRWRPSLGLALMSPRWSAASTSHAPSLPIFIVSWMNDR